MLREIARQPDIDLTVFYGSDFSIRGYKDEGFGVEVTWDVPLLDGYKHEFLPRLREGGTEGFFSLINYGILRRLAGDGETPAFDVLWLHGYSRPNQLYALLAAHALDIPVLMRSDSSLVDRPRGPIKLLAKKLTFALLGQLIAAVLVSGTLNSNYWRHYLGQGSPQFLLPYAVDNEWFQRKCALASLVREEFRSHLGLQPDRPVILFASKLQTRKHCNNLIAAYESLSPAPGAEPNAYLVIVGDGEERDALEAQATATGFTTIHFSGFRNQSEMPAFLDLCDVFVLPSRHEPWGLIVNEAMNAGRAVIVSDDVGCQPDLVTDGVEGCIFPVGDVPALADALRRVLTQPTTAREMGRKALERINRWSFSEDLVGLRNAIAHVTEGYDQGLPPLSSQHLKVSGARN